MSINHVTHFWHLSLDQSSRCSRQKPDRATVHRRALKSFKAVHYSKAGTHLKNQTEILHSIQIEMYFFIFNIRNCLSHVRAHEPRQPANLTDKILGQK